MTPADSWESRLRGIYAIVNEGENDPIDLAQNILLAGGRILQYRAKNGIAGDRARRLRQLTRDAGALFILNDDWKAALHHDADGVHLGPDDANVVTLPEIRRALGSRILGLSCGNADEARAAELAGADYIGAGCVFETKSKDDAGEPIGIAGLQSVVRATRLPVAAIGGITAERLPQIKAAGARMAAVIGAIANAASPRKATEELVAAWNVRATDR